MEGKGVYIADEEQGVYVGNELIAGVINKTGNPNDPYFNKPYITVINVSTYRTIKVTMIASGGAETTREVPPSSVYFINDVPKYEGAGIEWDVIDPEMTAQVRVVLEKHYAENNTVKSVYIADQNTTDCNWGTSWDMLENECFSGGTIINY